MKILVMSDSHGAARTLRAVLEKHRDADLVIHLGDGEREMAAILRSDPVLQEKLYYLKGNCDSGALIFRTELRLPLALPCGHKIFAAHGDAFQVKFSTRRIEHEASECGADIVLYGHTHVGDCRYENGRYIINPGSLGCPRDGKPPSYVLMDVSEQGVLPNRIFL